MSRFLGPLFILIAALLWGTDSLYRFPTAAALDPTFIVFGEHVVGIALLIPWIWYKHRPDLLKIGGAKGWLSAFVVGAGGGALATVLFTASFRYLNPSVTILIQKLQPLIVVLLAYLLLGERPTPKFYPWAVVALAAGFVLSFPDLDVSFLRESGNLHAKGVIYALASCGLWGVSTVAGRALLTRTNAPVATFWRYFFGTVTLVAILWAAQIPMPAVSTLTSHDVFVAMMYLSIMTGIIPMVIYYAGMARAQASVVTFVELAYPISAVILNTVFLGTALTPVQIIAGGVLLLAVTMISI